MSNKVFDQEVELLCVECLEDFTCKLKDMNHATRGHEYSGYTKWWLEIPCPNCGSMVWLDNEEEK